MAANASNNKLRFQNFPSIIKLVPNDVFLLRFFFLSVFLLDLNILHLLFCRILIQIYKLKFFVQSFPEYHVPVRIPSV